MPFYNYGSKNGMSTAVRLIRALCKIYTSYSSGIIAFINGSSMTTEQKALVTDWLNNAVTVCAVIESAVQVVYES